MNRQEFAKILRKAREEKNITQLELACRTGFTNRSIIFWEQGKKKISLENADKLLKALGIEITIGGKTDEREINID